MSETNAAHFSNRLLDASEWAQHHFGHTTPGRLMTRLVAGSESAAYQQLDWRSRSIVSIPAVPNAARASGDPEAGRFPRAWHNAAIIAASKNDLAALHDRAGAARSEHAVAYLSDGGVTRIGTLATEETLLRDLGTDDVMIALRLGKETLEATVGLWLGDERTFLGVQHPQTIEPFVAVSALPSAQYPNIVLA